MSRSVSSDNLSKATRHDYQLGAPCTEIYSLTLNDFADLRRYSFFDCMQACQKEGAGQHESEKRTGLVIGDHFGESKSRMHAHGQLRIVKARSKRGEVGVQVLRMFDE